MIVDFIDKYALVVEISEIKTLEFPSIFFLTTSVYSKLQPVLIWQLLPFENPTSALLTTASYSTIHLCLLTTFVSTIVLL